MTGTVIPFQPRSRVVKASGFGPDIAGSNPAAAASVLVLPVVRVDRARASDWEDFWNDMPSDGVPPYEAPEEDQA